MADTVEYPAGCCRHTGGVIPAEKCPRPPVWRYSPATRSRWLDDHRALFEPSHTDGWLDQIMRSKPGLTDGGQNKKRAVG